MGALLAALLQLGASAAYHCESGDHTARANALVLDANPGPLGMVIAQANDFEGTEAVQFASSHVIPVPGIQQAPGTVTVTHVMQNRERICTKPISFDRCPALRTLYDQFASASYPVMANRSRVAGGQGFHPHAAVVIARDGDGNASRTIGTSGHAAVSDVRKAFEALRPCVQDAYDATWAR